MGIIALFYLLGSGRRQDGEIRAGADGVTATVLHRGRELREQFTGLLRSLGFLQCFRQKAAVSVEGGENILFK